MSRIQIHQVQGAIQIETRSAYWQVIRSRRLALNIRNNRAELSVRSKPSRLNIDQSESFASAGLKTPLRLAGDFYASSLSAGLEAISTIVKEGLRFLRIENGGNPIRDVAMARGVHIGQLTVKSMPSVRPSINFEPGELNMEWTPHSVVTSWEVVDGHAEFVPHQVSIVMDPYPSVEIEVVEEEKIINPEEMKKNF